MRKLIILLVVSLMTSACNQGGVPQVDDPYNIVVNGEKMPQWKFLNKYCVKQAADPTCSKVRHAMEKNTKGEIPRF
jgi:hypothetical protein